MGIIDFVKNSFFANHEDFIDKGHIKGKVETSGNKQRFMKFTMLKQ